MDYQKLYSKISDDYSSKILNWAVKKTGSRPDGEDLANEVIYQIFVAASKEKNIAKLDNFIWKVAHFVWCNNLRTITKQKNAVPICEELIHDGIDFAEALVEEEALKGELTLMRRKIADLSRLRREAMILHYLDGLSICDVSKALDISVSAVKWHLFDARKKIKEELNTMKKDTSYVYRPGRLVLGISGMSGPDPDTKKVNSSLVRQNICLLCYKEGKTIDELCEYTGIPKSYLEYDLEWLADHEFLRLEKSRYYTNFAIVGRKHWQDVGTIYNETRSEYIDQIISYLEERENDIRKIGFYGSDIAFDRLLWAIIMLFISYFSRNSATCIQLKTMDDRAIRPDGGRYYIIGNNLSDEQSIDADGYFKPEGWNGYNGIHCCNLYENQPEAAFWLGVYNFENNAPEITDTNNKHTAQGWYRLFCSLVDPNFNVDSLSSDEKERLAHAVQKGMVVKAGNVYKPQFVIMTFAQHEQLKKEIFSPLLEVINNQVEKLAIRFESMHKRNIPNQAKGYLNYFTYIDLWNTGIYTLIFAAMDGKLLIPKTSDEGTPLTLVVMH